MYNTWIDWEPEDKTKCTCEIFLLMRNGCECGGFEAEQQAKEKVSFGEEAKEVKLKKFDEDSKASTKRELEKKSRQTQPYFPHNVSSDEDTQENVLPKYIGNYMWEGPGAYYFVVNSSPHFTGVNASTILVQNEEGYKSRCSQFRSYGKKLP